MANLVGKTLIAVLVLGSGILLPLQASADQILNSWNESNIQGSGDYVNVIIGDDDGRTTLTFQWRENDTSDDLWTAIGLDTIFYNSSVEVLRVMDQDGDNVTANWKLNFGGTNSGGGFGTMLSKKNLNAGGTGGIAPDSITLVLDGLTTLMPNSNGRYVIGAYSIRSGLLRLGIQRFA